MAKKTEKEYLIFVEGAGDRWMWTGSSLEEDSFPVFVPESCLKDEMDNVKEYMDEDTDTIWDECIIEVQEYKPKCYVYRTSTVKPL
jgi:hypothetical protein